MSKTAFVGIGTAGVTLLNKLYSVKGNDENCLFIAIESSSAESQTSITESNSVKRNYYYHLISKPNTFDRHLKNNEVPYIYEELRGPVNGDGAKRFRGASRYFMDMDSVSNNSVFRYFDQDLNNFLAQNGNTIGHVWLLHSLSGGTGSGSFPLICLYLKQLGIDLRNQDSKYDFSLYGIGLYSKSARGTFQSISTDQDIPVLCVNSFAAMRELNKLLWPQATGQTGKSLIMYGDNNLGQELDIDSRTFDKYFICSIDEVEANRSGKHYYDSIDKKIINSIDFLESASENLRVMQKQTSKLGNFNVTELSVDVEALTNYIQLRKDIEKNKKTISETVVFDEALYEKIWKWYAGLVHIDESQVDKFNIETLQNVSLFLKKKLDERKNEEEKHKKRSKLGNLIRDKKSNMIVNINNIDNRIKIEQCKNEIEIDTKRANDVLADLVKDKRYDNSNNLYIPLNQDKLEELALDLDLEKMSIDSILGMGIIDSNKLMTCLKDQYRLCISGLERVQGSLDPESNLTAQNLGLKYNDDLDGQAMMFDPAVFLLHDEKTVIVGAGQQSDYMDKSYQLNAQHLVQVIQDSNLGTNTHPGANRPLSLKFIAIQMGLNFNDMAFYQNMQYAFRQGQYESFSNLDKRFKDDSVGKIFAYPEFFINDPRVINAYPAYYVKGMLTPESFEKYWPTCSDPEKVLENLEKIKNATKGSDQ